MAAKTYHFRVDNGDMTLFEFESGRRLLVDCDIRAAADDPEHETPNVASQLRERLKRDGAGRLYVDAFLLTHPDEDHCRGLRSHFHLGPLEDWVKSDDKIVIREMWSSPIVFRRASTNHNLCEDAKAWNKEARRRVASFRAKRFSADGERILILGRDIDGKTDDLAAILVEVDTEFSKICGASDLTFSARLLAPLPGSDEDEEDVLSKNDSSVVLNLSLKANYVEGARYLLGGDAGVAIWEKVWDRNKDLKHVLEYDVLLHRITAHGGAFRGKAGPTSARRRKFRRTHATPSGRLAPAPKSSLRASPSSTTTTTRRAFARNANTSQSSSRRRASSTASPTARATSPMSLK